MRTTPRVFGIPVFAALALMAAASKPARADLIFAITDVNGFVTASASNTDGRTIEGGGRGGIIFGPGPGIGYASITHYYNLFGSPIDPALIQNISILPNPGSSTHPDETEVFSSGESASTDSDGNPIACASISFCTPTQDDVIYPVADITYADGTVDHVTFEWVVTPEPASILLLFSVVALTGFGIRRKLRQSQSTMVPTSPGPVL
jgi:hypothetical protein